MRGDGVVDGSRPTAPARSSGDRRAREQSPSAKRAVGDAVLGAVGGNLVRARRIAACAERKWACAPAGAALGVPGQLGGCGGGRFPDSRGRVRRDVWLHGVPGPPRANRRRGIRLLAAADVGAVSGLSFGSEVVVGGAAAFRSADDLERPLPSVDADSARQRDRRRSGTLAPLRVRRRAVRCRFAASLSLRSGTRRRFQRHRVTGNSRFGSDVHQVAAHAAYAGGSDRRLRP